MLLILSSYGTQSTKGHAMNRNKKEKPMGKTMQENSFKILYLPIASPEIKNIPIDECGEELIDLKEVKHERILPLITFGNAYNPGYQENGKVRIGLYKRLLLLLEYLPKNFGIAFLEGYRPLGKQKEYFDKIFREVAGQCKGDLEKAYAQTSIFVSPYIDNVPVHCTGAAIDFTLFTFNDAGIKSLLNLGTLDAVDQAPTLTDTITEEQRNNRMLLLNATCKAGLVNYGYEWWHYSYGDRAWAYVEKKEKAIYGLVTEDNKIYIPTSKEEYFKKFKC